MSLPFCCTNCGPNLDVVAAVVLMLIAQLRLGIDGREWECQLHCNLCKGQGRKKNLIFSEQSHITSTTHLNDNSSMFNNIAVLVIELFGIGGQVAHDHLAAILHFIERNKRIEASASVFVGSKFLRATRSHWAMAFKQTVCFLLRSFAPRHAA